MSALDTEEPLVPAREEALIKLRGLPPLSAVAVQLQLLARDDLDIGDVAEMIKADAALSADVLYLANSPLFGMRKTVTGLMHAVALMGLNGVMRLVITAALRSFGNPARGTAALNRCWRHNLACGLICEELAHQVDLDPDVAYTAGLLHDIGRCGMLCVWTKSYSGLLDKAAADPLALMAMERQELGITHADAGGVLLGKWHLPKVLVEAARLHHNAPEPDVTDTIGLVHCGCGLSDSLGFIVTGQSGSEDLLADVPAPWRDILANLPEGFNLDIARRVDSLNANFLS